MRGATQPGMTLKRQLARRWPVVIGFLVIVFVIELVEHSGRLSAAQMRVFAPAQLATYLVVMPLLAWRLLHIMARSDRERYQAVDTLARYSRFSHQLNQVANWEELAICVASFPAGLFAHGRSALFLYDINNREYTTHVSVEWLDGVKTIVERLQVVGAEDAEAIMSIDGFAPRPDAGAGGLMRDYYLPLRTGSQPTGFLWVSLPAQPPVSADERALIESVAPDITLAASNIVLREAITSQLESAEAERRRIAQDLHDSLGQNIGYLRLKLDQMSGDGAPAASMATRQELERMRDIADEAYQQMRATLDDLQPASQVNLYSALVDRAQYIGRRGGFQVTLKQNGSPVLLPARFKRQVMYICQEALINIEKHACASQVDIILDWLEAEFRITIMDNGRGFHPSVLEDPGHYGLLIMQERAQDIQADLQVSSMVSKGTKVFICVPLTHVNPHARHAGNPVTPDAEAAADPLSSEAT